MPICPSSRPSSSSSSASASSSALASSPPRPARPARRGAAALVALVSVAVLVLAGCMPKATVADLDRTLYATSLPAFSSWWRGEQAAANHVSRSTVDRWLAVSPDRLDTAASRARAWDVSTDLCSSAPDTGPVFDFRWPCIRHDFAWRNLRRLGVGTRARRLEASRQFLRDMDASCAGRSRVQRTPCRAVARTYFAAVSAVA